MKRVSAFLMVVIMIFSLAACGADSQESEMDSVETEVVSDTEAWRSQDETQHTVTVSDFYMSMYEVTQAEYTEVMGSNPSSFSGGSSLPDGVTEWLVTNGILE